MTFNPLISQKLHFNLTDQNPGTNRHPNIIKMAGRTLVAVDPISCAVRWAFLRSSVTEYEFNGLQL